MARRPVVSDAWFSPLSVCVCFSFQLLQSMKSLSSVVSSSHGHRKPVGSGLYILIPGGKSQQQVLQGSVEAALMHVLSYWQLGVYSTPSLAVLRF